MLLFAGLGLRLLVFGTLVAPAFSLQFSFTSVQQCATLELSFSGLTSPVSGTPSSLTIIPFNATAIVVPLNNPNFTTGIILSPLPFLAGSEFIVSLDDANGNDIINNSDIFPVLPSPKKNSSCIPDPDEIAPKFFTMASPVVYQCQDFTINFNTTVSPQAPSVRLYIPSGPSFTLNTTSVDLANGMATYTMALPYGLGTVLALDNGEGTTEATPLLLVGGDSSSPKGCLPPGFVDIAVSNNTTTTHTSTANTYRTVAIIAAVVGTFAVLLGICLATFALRYHRRCRCQNIEFDGIASSEIDSHDKKPTIPGVIVLDDPLPPQFENNTVNTFTFSPEDGYYDMNSLLSWSPAIHEDQRYPPWFEEKKSPDTAQRSCNSIVFSSPIIPQIALLQPPPIGRSLSKRHLRAPSDVPADLNSRAWSADSSESFYPSVCETPNSHVGSLNGRSAGLPASPRNGLGPSISRVPWKETHTRTQEWYGNVL